MGQKVNPIGLRLGINRTWDSRWYAGETEYSGMLHEADLLLIGGPGTGSSSMRTALQQRNCGTRQIASENVHVYCVWIGTHEWLPVELRVSPRHLPLLARVGPTTPKSIDPRCLWSANTEVD